MENSKSRKQELREQLLFFNPEIIFAGTPGGLELVMQIEAADSRIKWKVCMGDQSYVFATFDEACDYYLSMSGERRKS